MGENDSNHSFLLFFLLIVLPVKLCLQNIPQKLNLSEHKTHTNIKCENVSMI